jgi:phage tail protein X
LVEGIQNDVARLAEHLVGLRAGTKYPKQVSKYATRNKEMVDWAVATEYERENGLTQAIRDSERRIAAGKQMSAYLLDMADRIHGTALIEVDLDATKPAPISWDEKRKFESGLVASITRIDGARVYWKGTRANGTPAQGWVGTSAWRRMEKVEVAK